MPGYNNSTNRDGEHTFRGLHLLLRIIFAVYLFTYFYCLQSPLLSLAQHQLSKGVTSFHPLIGSCIATVVLLIVQIGVQRRVAFRSHAYVLSFVPSAILAVLPTAFTPETSISILVVSLLVFLFWLLLCFGRGNLLKLFTFDTQVTTAGRICRHLVLFSLVFMYMGLCSHHSEMLASEVKASKHLSKGEYLEAFGTSQNTMSSSPRLIALKAFAATHLPGGLGERLFTLPLPQGGSDILLMDVNDTLSCLFSPVKIYQELAATPQENERVQEFLHRAVTADTLSNFLLRDYLLSACLLDKDLDSFVQHLPSYRTKEDTTALPRHYEEALLLYNTLHGKRNEIHSSSNLQEHFQKFNRALRQCSDSTCRANKLRNEFAKTYWWYYYCS